MFLRKTANNFWQGVLWNADGGGGDPAPAAAPADPPAADPASVLYPDADKKPEGDPKPADAAPEWKEFIPDPAKTDEENAAAKAEHDKAKPAGGDAADKVPEDGKYELAMPEGVEVDQGLLDALGPEFKDLGLTTKQAQKLADKFIEAQQAKAKSAAESWGKTVAGWVDQAKADPEIGGDKWNDTARNASGVIEKFGSPELKQYLNETGGGNHPELIRFAAKAGARIAELEAMVSEDNPGVGDPPGGKTAKDAASILYPNDTPKKG